jgi:hypothetical protein
LNPSSRDARQTHDDIVRQSRRRDYDIEVIKFLVDQEHACSTTVIWIAINHGNDSNSDRDVLSSIGIGHTTGGEFIA